MYCVESVPRQTERYITPVGDSERRMQREAFCLVGLHFVETGHLFLFLVRMFLSQVSKFSAPDWTYQAMYIG